jgi:hypothetical protein
MRVCPTAALRVVEKTDVAIPHLYRWRSVTGKNGLRHTVLSFGKM